MNVIEPSLVEEAFEFLDQIRVPQNPSRILTLATRTYSSHNISGYLSPETALDMELMTPDIPNVPILGKSESTYTDREGNEVTVLPSMGMDNMDGQSSVYRPTDEPEPWDLIQLNVQASVMCLTSKIKTYCNRMENVSNERKLESEVTDKDSFSELQSSVKDKASKSKQKESSPSLENVNERTSPIKKGVSVSEAQNISPNLAAQSQNCISSSVGSDSSQVSSRSMSSSLGVSRTNESQRSSCSATPDVSPCEEDSGIGLERVSSEVERTDCISEGGLSVDEERREDLLPLDKTDVKRGEKEDYIQTSDSRFLCDSSSVKSSKLESIMEQSIEDLGPTLEEPRKENCNGTLLSEDLECSEKDVSVNKDSHIQLIPNDSVCDNSRINENVSDKENVGWSNGKEKENEINNKPVNNSSSSDRAEKRETISGTNNSTCVQNIKESHTGEDLDWVGEVRPSMKKLRQAMDGLMRTARLVHSVFRLQQTPDAAQVSHSIKYRRDICFSQAVSNLYKCFLFH